MCYSCAGADGLGLQLAVVRLCEWIFSLLIAESFQFWRAIYPGSAEDTADIKRQQESIKNEMDLSVGCESMPGAMCPTTLSPGHGEPPYGAGDGGCGQKLV